MRTVGVRCTKDRIDWAVVDGDQRSSASLVDRDLVSIPPGERGEQLAWVRKEVQELMERFAVDAVAIRVAESGGQSVSLGRSEVEGVVQEAFAAGGACPTRHVAASIRGAFRAKTKKALEPLLEAVPLVAATPATRREAVISAVALLPE
jgi:Holliday junction resolvasome RuvABC endonuclease subunit